MRPYSYSRLCRVLLSIGALSLLLTGSALAQRIHVTVNGDPVQFEGMGAQQIQGRVMVPVRGVLEKMGADIAWMPETETVVASSGDIDIHLKLGSRRATVNGRTVLLDVPAQEIAGHTFVPLRFLSEALGADVGWNEATRTVTINTTGETNSSIGFHREPISPPSAEARAPKFVNRSPKPDSIIMTARPRIYAEFDTGEGSPIRTSSVRLYFDGQDVTDDATITRDSISYRPDDALEYGPHKVRIVVSDRAGHRAVSQWIFVKH